MVDAYRIDLREWPARLDLLFGEANEQTTWRSVGDVSWNIGTSVLIDLDVRDRCCGLEIMDLAVIAPWKDSATAGGAAVSLQKGVLLMPPTAEGTERIRRWARGITCFADDGGPYLSLHWQRGSYHYSEEIEDMDAGAMGWLTVGICDEKFVGLRIQNPTDHVRGLSSGVPSLVDALRAWVRKLGPGWHS